MSNHVLSSTYQGTPYDPYSSSPKGRLFRTIGINRTAFLSLSQIRGDLPDPVKSIQWITFASNVYNALVPQLCKRNRSADVFLQHETAVQYQHASTGTTV